MSEQKDTRVPLEHILRHHVEGAYATVQYIEKPFANSTIVNITTHSRFAYADGTYSENVDVVSILHQDLQAIEKLMLSTS